MLGLLSFLTVSGCSTTDSRSKSNKTSTATSEKDYPVHFSPFPDGFKAYYYNKLLDVDLSETDPVQVMLPVEVQKNQGDIRLKNELPLLNNTEIIWREIITTNIQKDELAKFYTKQKIINYTILR